MEIENTKTTKTTKKPIKIKIKPIIETPIETKTTEKTIRKPVVTEDLGKIFEMAICMLFEIEYDGHYKYSLEEARRIKDLLYKLKQVFPHKIQHIAKRGNRYDFASVDDNVVYLKVPTELTVNSQSKFLSAKTTKKDAKVCPQVIGQPSKHKFCAFFELDESTNDLENIKLFIQNNISMLLQKYSEHTFDCPIVYYNKHKNRILFVKLKENINWTNLGISFSHITKNKKWNESSCISIGKITIGEFQVHNHRDCIKFRWAFEKLLDLFRDNFDIIVL